MSVARKDLQLCIGCGRCFELCPMDVFRMNKELGKSVIAYPENCQSCGMCYYNCPTGSLTIVNETFGYGSTAYRAPTSVALNHTESPARQVNVKLAEPDTGSRGETSG